MRVFARAAAGVGFAGRAAGRTTPGSCPNAGCTRSCLFGIRGLFSQTLHFLAHSPVELLDGAVELLIEGNRRLIARGRRSRGRLGARLLAGVAGQAATLAAGHRFTSSTSPACPFLTVLALTGFRRAFRAFTTALSALACSGLSTPASSFGALLPTGSAGGWRLFLGRLGRRL